MKFKSKVVIIGGAGFLGSHLADAFTEDGYAVTIFDLQESPWLRENQEMVVGDVLVPEQVLDAIEGAEFVYHLAGVADISQATLNPKETIETNIIGSTNVIEACIKRDVKRIFFASTLYVYSQKGSFYRASKQAVEAILEAYHEQSGLEYTILRYGSLYGPRAQEWNGLKQFVAQAARDGRIIYPGTGEERREYIHVKDAAKLSIQALAPKFANQCLTLTGTQTLSTREVMFMIREILGREIKIDFSRSDSHYGIFHYSLTPYRYTPRRGEKIVPSMFIDLGQGILDLIEEVECELHKRFE